MLLIKDCMDCSRPASSGRARSDGIVTWFMHTCSKSGHPAYQDPSCSHTHPVPHYKKHTTRQLGRRNSLTYHHNYDTVSPAVVALLLEVLHPHPADPLAPPPLGKPLVLHLPCQQQTPASSWLLCWAVLHACTATHHTRISSTHTGVTCRLRLCSKKDPTCCSPTAYPP